MWLGLFFLVCFGNSRRAKQENKEATNQWHRSLIARKRRREIDFWLSSPEETAPTQRRPDFDIGSSAPQSSFTRRYHRKRRRRSAKWRRHRRRAPTAASMAHTAKLGTSHRPSIRFRGEVSAARRRRPTSSSSARHAHSWCAFLFRWPPPAPPPPPPPPAPPRPLAFVNAGVPREPSASLSAPP